MNSSPAWETEKRWKRRFCVLYFKNFVEAGVGGGGGGACPQTPLVACAFGAKKITRPMLSQLCQLLYKTSENPALSVQFDVTAETKFRIRNCPTQTIYTGRFYSI